MVQEDGEDFVADDRVGSGDKELEDVGDEVALGGREVGEEVLEDGETLEEGGLIGGVQTAVHLVDL